MQRLFLWLATGAVAVAALYGVWRFWTYDSSFFVTAANSLPDELAAAKAEGLPLEPDDLRPNPPIPEAQNAAPIYVELIADSQKYSSGSMHKPLQDWAAKPSASSLASAKKRLSELAPAIRKLGAVSKRPHADFHRKYEDGPAMLLPEYVWLKTFTRVLAYKARIDAMEGRTAEALEALGAVTRIANHVAQEPILIGLLVSIACDGIAARSVEIIASQFADDARSLSELEAFMASLSPVPNFGDYFGAEVVGGRIAFGQLPMEDLVKLAAGGSNIASHALETNKAVKVSAETRKQAYEAQWVRFCRKKYEILKRHKDDPHRAGLALDALVQANSSQEDPTYIAVEVMAPIYHHAGSSVTRMAVRRDLNKLKIDLLQYRLGHGKYPKTLAELGSKLIDPFTGKALIYKATAKGFLAYSVGPDAIDNGGDPGADVSVEHPLSPKKK